MKAKDIIIASVVSASLTNCEAKKEDANSEFSTQPLITEQVGEFVQNKPIFNVVESEKEELNICLSLDSDDSFTHKKVLESIENPENVVIEFPLSQLYQKYGNRPHPLSVSGVGKNFRALLAKGGIEQLINDIPQKLPSHTGEITSDTKYLIDDTLRFQLINSQIEGYFPKSLNEQLQEDGFETFSNPDSIVKRNSFDGFPGAKKLDKSDFCYDIVVKKLPDGKYGLALYRDGELFMATYVSVGLNSRKTKRGQFKVLRKNPYYYSRKYKSPMPEGLEFDEGGFRMHQGNVTGYPASHGCVRVPGAYVSILFSLVDYADIFISKNLYSVQ